MTKRLTIYQPLDLIELMEQRPCLWDKTLDDYKDRVKKGRAWREIYSYLIKGFENLEEEEQVTAGKVINEKWKRIRDAFAHALKKERAGKRTKKYIYSDYLQFLSKIVVKDETESSITDNTMDSQQSEDKEMFSLSYTLGTNPELGPSCSCSRKRIKRPSYDETDKAILKKLAATSQPPPEIDEDTSFFASIIPSVKKFDEDEKLEFRMGVLSLIKDIKEKKMRATI